jgi:hypothetical protein
MVNGEWPVAYRPWSVVRGLSPICPENRNLPAHASLFYHNFCNCPFCMDVSWPQQYARLLSLTPSLFSLKKICQQKYLYG